MTTAIDKSLAKLALQINEAHRQCEQSARGSLELAAAAGDLLLKAKDAVEHGQWLPWLKTNFAGSQQAASMYMRVASGRQLLESNYQRISNLNLTSAVKFLTKQGNRKPRTKSDATPEPAAPDGDAGEPEFEVAEMVDAEVVSTSLVDTAPLAALERAEAEQCDDAEHVESLESMVAAGRKFACIMADPPWKYGNQATRASTDNHYQTMTVEEIAALPVMELAADDAHLHLWVTNGFLFESKAIIDAWGFEFRSTFVWCKPQMGIGNYWRNSHEILLTCIRGDAKRFNDRSLKSWGEFDRGAHSAKPEKVREYIERASPGPRLELFGRSTVPGWTVWGNQVSKGLFNAGAV